MPDFITTKPVFKPEISFEIEVLEEKATIVHCQHQGNSLVRIWPTTYLVQENGDRKKLLFAYNISPYPEWKWIGRGHVFTLIFEPLDKTTLLFNLLEDIPETGGFKVKNIERNQSDVYWVHIK